MPGVEFFGNFRAAPTWAADFGGREHILPWPARLDPGQFTDALAVRVTVAAAGAAANATSVPVAALVPPGLADTTAIAGGGVLLQAGTVLYFGGQKVARLTAAARVGDTSLAVAALPTALDANDAAAHSPGNGLLVPSGTIVGRTWAERDANAAFGPAADADDEVFPVVFDVVDANRNADCELYRPGSLVRENYLPGYGAGRPLGTSAAPSALLTKLRARYQCITGTN